MRALSARRGAGGRAERRNGALALERVMNGEDVPARAAVAACIGRGDGGRARAACSMRDKRSLDWLALQRPWTSGRTSTSRTRRRSPSFTLLPPRVPAWPLQSEQVGSADLFRGRARRPSAVAQMRARVREVCWCAAHFRASKVQLSPVVKVPMRARRWPLPGPRMVNRAWLPARRCTRAQPRAFQMQCFPCIFAWRLCSRHRRGTQRSKAPRCTMQ